MSVTRFKLNLCFILIFAHTTLAGFPVPYPQLQPAAPLPLAPHLIYNSPNDGNIDLSGFSYFTRTLDGGQSEVVFITGPNSDTKMTNEVAAMKDLTSSLPSNSDALGSELKESKDNKEDNSSTEKNEDGSAPTLVIPSDSKDISTPSAMNDVTSATGKPKEGTGNIDQDGTKEIINNEQLIPGNIAAFEAPPYPILRFGASASYYPQLITRFSGYEPSEYYRSQYDPSYFAHYNSYQSLYNPLYPSFENNYYNPIVPSLYSNTFFTPQVSNFITGESPESLGQDSGKTETATPSEMDKKIVGEGEKEGDSNKTESAADQDSAKVSESITDRVEFEKTTELSTSTEQLTETSSVSSTQNTATSEKTQPTLVVADSTETTTAAA